MNVAANLEWKTDLRAMSCHNVKNDVVVLFEKKGNEIYGKIKNIPIKLFKKIDSKQTWEVMLNNFIIEAGKFFMMEYNENEACN